MGGREPRPGGASAGRDAAGADQDVDRSAVGVTTTLAATDSPNLHATRKPLTNEDIVLCLIHRNEAGEAPTLSEQQLSHSLNEEGARNIVFPRDRKITRLNSSH